MQEKTLRNIGITQKLKIEATELKSILNFDLFCHLVHQVAFYQNLNLEVGFLGVDISQNPLKADFFMNYKFSKISHFSGTFLIFMSLITAFFAVFGDFLPFVNQKKLPTFRLHFLSLLLRNGWILKCMHLTCKKALSGFQLLFLMFWAFS